MMQLCDNLPNQVHWDALSIFFFFFLNWNHPTVNKELYMTQENWDKQKDKTCLFPGGEDGVSHFVLPLSKVPLTRRVERCL